MVNYTPITRGTEKKKSLRVNLPNIESIMKKSYKFFYEEDSILDAVKMLTKLEVSGLPVLDEERRPVGFLSERDCLRLVHEMKYHNSIETHIGAYMSRNVVTLPASSNLNDAIKIFSETYYHVLPIIRYGKVIGILDRHMVLKSVAKLAQTTW